MGTGLIDETLARQNEFGFTEADAWQNVGAGWRQLSGSFQDLGFSIEWHDFVAHRKIEWSKSFHPAGLEICLNLSGTAEVQFERDSLELECRTAGFYAQKRPELKASRRAGEWHLFATVEFSLPFLKSHAEVGRGLHPVVARLLAGREKPTASVSEASRLSSAQEQVVRSLRHPPVYRAAQPMWYRAKALEIAATVLYHPSTDEELFCQKIKRLNRERAQKVVAILDENLAEPPALEEIGRRVGCSHFYLSRIFAQEMGKSITAYLRDLRLERAALLLRTGDCNVTEAALEVGYSSLSHFTVAFREAFGCCPGLYPLKAPRKSTQAQA